MGIIKTPCLTRGSRKHGVFIIPLIFSLFLFSSGCASLPFLTEGPSPPPGGPELLDALIREITNELSTVPLEEFDPGKRLLITTFVELNDLKKSSAFGRLLSERLMTFMGDLGFPVIEIRRGHSIYLIEKEGEMVLTRNAGEVDDTIHAGAVIYGTYMASDRDVLVTARIARASDFQILKSWNGRIPKTPFIADLLKEDDKRDDLQHQPDTGVYEYLPAK
jgi:hypothetical protein